jgi:hypothetical protein
VLRRMGPLTTTVSSPPPSKKNRCWYAVGSVYKGHMVRPIVYEGAGNAPATPARGQSHIVVQPSPGHQKDLADSSSPQALEAVNDGWEDVGEDSYAPPMLLQHGYASLLGSTMSAPSHGGRSPRKLQWTAGSTYCSPLSGHSCIGARRLPMASMRGLALAL